MTCSDFQVRVRDVKNPCISRKPCNPSNNYDELREVKGKGEKQRYTHLNAEFQRIARKDKKAFLSDRCKEIEENKNGKDYRSLQKNYRYQGNISCKDGLNNGQKW